ncbi:MAG: chemotaxis protein CheB, partial [Candidatus Eremiobacteraeota bacterium]|nr:chemotaxis protein CheB [Candidatus Eremiobacteraeota bacterium]
MTHAPQDSHLFVVGASAGGIDALERFVAALPANFPGSIVIAQHLAPSRPSLLEPILARQTQLPLTTVTDRARLENGRIYLIPGGRHAEILDGEIVLSSKDKRSRPQPSIDLLFESAAAAYAERVIAVVLSGMGRDGAAGAAAVKDAGGMVIVQEPVSAAFPALPESIPISLVDLVTDIDAMGAVIS